MSSVIRTDMGVKGRDYYGNQFGILFGQVADIEKKPYGCGVRLKTGELIPLSMGYDRAKVYFKERL